MRKILTGLALLALTPATADALMPNFKAKVTAYTADGDLIEEQTLACPTRDSICEFVFNVPFDGEFGTAVLKIKEPWPGYLSAYMGARGLSGKVDFERKSGENVELEAYPFVPLGPRDAPWIGHDSIVAKFIIEIL